MSSSKYLTRQQVEKEYPIKAWTLAHLASQKRGPRYAIVGKNAVYARTDIESWIDSLMVEPSQSVGTGG
ncbi:hypothetical protein [Magnetospirillum sp. 15-1]|uniref:hypothetical protein n=1 Tax=Magnetospirillum sp. 15-1 TaxID=1979370 RepID=UPI000BBCA045|nr:hypothetical protein [Magnetospirillum sp. 15-1]